MTVQSSSGATRQSRIALAVATLMAVALVFTRPDLSDDWLLAYDSVLLFAIFALIALATDRAAGLLAAGVTGVVAVAAILALLGVEAVSVRWPAAILLLAVWLGVAAGRHLRHRRAVGAWVGRV